MQNPNHQPNRWVSKLKGHTEELAKQNTFTTSTPVQDDAAVFLLEVTLKDEVTRAAHDKNGSLTPTSDNIKDNPLGKSSLSTDSPLSWLIT